jgi:glucuronate isomerase
MLNENRLLPAEPGVRRVARFLYEHTRSLPIVSPHGHCDPSELASNSALGDPAFELVSKDHYILRLLYSQGVPLEALGVHAKDGAAPEVDGREVWRAFATHYHLFRGTPSKLWLDYTLAEVFGVQVPLRVETADEVYDEVAVRLREEEFRPRALYERFGVEFLATTDRALDPLDSHACLGKSGWAGRVVPTFRPDDIIDPDRAEFLQNLADLAVVTGEDTSRWRGYLEAIRTRRGSFLEAGATSSDHGHPSPVTVDLSDRAAEALFDRIVSGRALPGEAEIFRGEMLVQMAAMSLDDGLVLQLHTGSWRDHNPWLTARFGKDVGADIPASADYVGALKPLLDRYGNERSLVVVVYTLDETTLSRELAPLAGHYPALRLGAPWWFYDSPEGIRRFYRHVIETAGFANTVGFNDDARSLLTIPARHDLVRRVNAGFLAALVAEHVLEMSDAEEIAEDLAYNLARRVFGVAP